MDEGRARSQYGCTPRISTGDRVLCWSHCSRVMSFQRGVTQPQATYVRRITLNCRLQGDEALSVLEVLLSRGAAQPSTAHSEDWVFMHSGLLLIHRPSTQTRREQ